MPAYPLGQGEDRGLYPRVADGDVQECDDLGHSLSQRRGAEIFASETLAPACFASVGAEWPVQWLPFVLSLSLLTTVIQQQISTKGRS